MASQPENLIALNDGRDVLVWRPGMGRTVEIYDICVRTERRRGVGRKLIAMLRDEVPENTALVYAITRLSNTIAHEFYEAIGFRLVGRLHNFYADRTQVNGKIINNTEHGLMYGLDL